MKNIFLLFLAITICFADKIDADLAKKVKDETAKLVKALDKKDYKVMVEATHPKMLELMGGKETVLKMSKQALDNVEKMDIKMKYSYKAPTDIYYSSNKDAVTFVPLEVFTESPDAQMVNKGFMIVSSSDKKKWYFINGGNKEQAMQILDHLFPGLPKDINIPKVEQKIVEKNKEVKGEVKKGTQEEPKEEKKEESK